MANKDNTVMQFKITLNDFTPKIWRRIIAPSAYSFFDFHCAIQDAFGWTDLHLHSFYIAQKGTARLISIQFPDPDNDFPIREDDDLDERKEKIADYFGVRVKQCQYTYDFGDNWDHTIVFEKAFSAETGQKYPICTAGENACPPEDCGGVGGYDELIAILKNPKNKEYREMCEWLEIDSGKEFDPTEFDLKDIFFENPRQRLKVWEE